ncbi:type III PLP-dependent enzyme [Polymorphospora sp. NPDC051019]|uniref:type III PLP-dependent enzyme n=1 Tax=Polymorphospora sp. NPDC051019 TaxID=3155725 RepID=UPI0034153311
MTPNGVRPADATGAGDRAGHPAAPTTVAAPDHAALARRFGTPAYVYDLDEVTRALGDLSASLPTGTRVYYSLKANPHPALVAALVSAGCHPEITSSGEVDVALTAGADPADCLYTGPGKTPGALAYALDRGVRVFSVESRTDLLRLDTAATGHGVRVDCLVRVNGSAAGGSGLRMTGTASQFGVDLADVPALLDTAARCPAVTVRGAHFYSITNAATEEALVAELCGSIRTAAWLREKGLPLEVLDIGGGFAAPYARPGERVGYPGLAAALTAELDDRVAGWRDGDPRIAVETGRHLVGTSGTLLTTVLDVKDSHGRRFAVLDAGINHLGGLSGLRRLLPTSAQPIQAVAKEADDAGVDLAGPLCTPLDMLGHGLGLPGLAPGDVLAIPNVGAYGLSASLLGFLSHPVPTEVVVAGGRVVSASRIELRREPVPAGD